MNCSICHKDFEDDDDVVAVDRFHPIDWPRRIGYVHLWHLSALPSSGSGR